MYGVHDSKKLYRLTFSRSLADLIVKGNSKLKVSKFEFRVGKTLKINEKSCNGLYAILDKRSGLVLRISMIQEIAELQRDENYRVLSECFVKLI